MKKVIVHTDGGARGNPGPAGAGAVLYDTHGEVLREAKKFLGETTNNVAEYAAVLLGLETVVAHFGKQQCKNIEVLVRMDSELVCKQLNGEYKIKEQTLFPYYIAIHNMQVSTLPQVSFEHVRREENKRADALANEAMDQGVR